MKRREFITLLSGAATASVAGPLVAWAQQREQKRRVAVLMGGSSQGDPNAQTEVAAFEEGLEALGWKPGSNIDLDYRWPGAALDRVRAAADAIAATRPE